MKKLLLLFCIIIAFVPTLHAQDPVSVNPNNTGANVTLNWLNNVARLRVGGSDPGASNGFDIQGPSNVSLLRIGGNGNVGIGSALIGNYRMIIRQSSNGSGYGWQVLNAAGDRSAQFFVGSGSAALDAEGQTNLILRTKGLDRMYIRNSDGFIGMGTSDPMSIAHVRSGVVALNATGTYGANLIVEGTSSGRSTTEGATLGFVVPANTNGSNPYQQGRIVVTPDNTANANASGRMYLQTRFYGNGAWEWRDNLVLLSSGNVGIGTATPSELLSVNGTIRSKEVKVEAGPWPDYVFEDGYDLLSLEETEEFIRENGHLPNIPSAEQVAAEGIALGEMNARLLEKIEELTLYIIQQEKELQMLKGQNVRIEELERKLEEIALLLEK